MKVAIVVVQFPPKWLAGTEIATYNIATQLSKKGHEVHVITRSAKGLLKYEKENGFHIHRVIFPSIKYIGDVFFWMGIVFCLRKIDPQIIHIQMIHMGMPGFLANKILRKKYLVYCRGSDVYVEWSFKRIISRLVLDNAASVIVLTEDMKKEVSKIYKKEITVIPNGIDARKYEILLTTLVKKDKENTILYAGSLRPIKGVKYLIEAMGTIIKEEPNTRLIIIGDGIERKRLEMMTTDNKLNDHVTFIGEIPYNDVPKYMVNSDIFALPSLSEGFPNVVLEAMASGLPVVCTDVGGLKEIIENGKNGFMVNPENSSELGSKILSLIKDHELRDNMSKQNIVHVKKYSWDNVTTKIENVYEMLVNNNTKEPRSKL